MSLMSSDNITNLLQTFLDVQSRRAEVISSNIANADTPGYSAKKLEFEDFLKEAARRSKLPRFQQEQRQALSADSLRVIEQTPTAIGMDGNSVDAAKEMSELAQTSINFNLGAKMLQSRLRLLRTAIREGK